MKKITIFDVFNLEAELSKFTTQGLLEDSLELLGIRYFEGSGKEGNESRVVYEYSNTRTMAIEVSFETREIRFWGWIGTRIEGEYFWEYLLKRDFDSFNRILYMLISKYFSTTSKPIGCEIVGNSSTDVFQKWVIAEGYLDDDEEDEHVGGHSMRERNKLETRNNKQELSGLVTILLLVILLIASSPVVIKILLWLIGE